MNNATKKGRNMDNETRPFNQCSRNERAKCMRGWTIGQCLEFAEALEENEDHMGEQSALHVTCSQYNLNGHDEYVAVMCSLPEGDWWKTPFRQKVSA